MDRTYFEKISIIGREAYAILCAVAYLYAEYPERNWTPIINKMWEVVESHERDEWAYTFSEIIPEFIFEPASFEEAHFERMTKVQYDVYINLLKETDENINTIFMALYDIIMDYAYTSIPGVGEDTLDDLESVCNCLEEKSIPLPDKKLVAFLPFSENHGWGAPFESNVLRR